MIWTHKDHLSKGMLRAESCEFRGASALITLHEQKVPHHADAFAIVFSVNHEEASIAHQIPDIKLAHTEDTFNGIKKTLEQVMNILPDKGDSEAETKLERFVNEVLDLQYIG